MLYNVIYPEVKQKYLMVSELNVDWKKSPFDVFYANILINHNVSYSDKLELLKNTMVKWTFKDKTSNLDLLSLVLINEISPWQKKLNVYVYKKSEKYNEDLDNLCFYIVEQMIKNGVNPLNDSSVKGNNYNSIDLIMFFGLHKTFKLFFESKYRKDDFIETLINKTIIYPTCRDVIIDHKMLPVEIEFFLSMVENDFIEIIDILLKNGFPVQFLNNKNENAFFYITSKGMAELLQKHKISTKSIKNTNNLSIKEFILYRKSFLNLSDADINGITVSLNNYLEIEDEKIIKEVTFSFLSDNCTNFKKLVQKLADRINITKQISLPMYSTTKGEYEEKIEVDIVKNILLNIWNENNAASIYKIDKLHSKILFLLQTLISYNKGILTQQIDNTINLDYVDFILLTTKSAGVLTAPYTGSTKERDELKSIERFINFINDNSNKNIKFTDVRNSSEDKCINLSYFLNKYNIFMDSLKPMVLDVKSLWQIKNIATEILNKKEKYTSEEIEMAKTLLIKIELKSSNTDRYSILANLSAESLEEIFLKHWSKSRMNTENLKEEKFDDRMDISKKTIMESREWIYNNRKNLYKNDTIKEFAHYVCKEIANSPEYEQYIQPFLLEVDNEEMFGEKKAISKNNRL